MFLMTKHRHDSDCLVAMRQGHFHWPCSVPPASCEKTRDSAWDAISVVFAIDVVFIDVVFNESHLRSLNIYTFGEASMTILRHLLSLPEIQAIVVPNSCMSSE